MMREGISLRCDIQEWNWRKDLTTRYGMVRERGLHPLFTLNTLTLEVAYSFLRVWVLESISIDPKTVFEICSCG